ncbi:hypothetical protein U0C82_02650 [Fulvimarina sp. 2208YS6-2-32]|uniref:Uncharacterized protein n=1 Tax=Fulvimarina uroteuthidis TaxID=3098149 RepID=A0ABU5HY36_9HYPH|nr:hypothetical protein [Fulvimarina sp. 2208YS6-2-32]MDY8108049.1 hypothetical protein [Fulvimarina sp. 2208YS6-2-32]
MVDAVKSYSVKSQSSIPFSNKIDGSKRYLSDLDQFAYDQLRLLIAQNNGKAPTIRKSIKEHIHDLRLLMHYLAMSLSKPDVRGVAISLRSNDYGKDQYSDLSYTRMKRLVDMLLSGNGDNGAWCYIDGMYFDKNRGYGTKSRIYANDVLADRMLHAGLIFPSFPYEPMLRKALVSPLQLSVNETPNEDEGDSDRIPLTRKYRDNEAVIPLLTARLKSAKPQIVLETYQQYKRSFVWDHKRQAQRSRLYEGNDQFYRLMSGEDGRGGRVYGHWIQRVPSDYRQFIRFKGEPVVEHDFRAMQPALSYSAIGQPYEGDPYDVPGYSSHYRDRFKLVFRVSVGCGPAENVLDKIRGVMIKEGFKPKAEEAEELYKAFWSHHSKIAHIVGQSAWTWLQKMESDISLKIVSSLLDQGIPCCPIFDSFLVAERHKDALMQAMIDAVSGLSCQPVPVKKS